ncbi:glycoside hydrolase family 2 protein [Martelella alba]|uniref:beta-mannosidase n=1 Tax=Martelella alba TaxID=2590451 RepID=A0A506UJR5_9HYPH|nr:glycoside hydrolase family 2 protein [Martelella alba]TPW33560.1 glycoside hydrolase family 2 protein [Martelella alba]
MTHEPVLADETASVDLTGIWTLTSIDGVHSCPISFPGDGHSALQAAGIIPDPYSGKNEDVVQWVGESDWIVERHFTLEDASGSWYLDIDNLDTVATVLINGQVVLEADNCFRRYRPDVSKALRSGENAIRIFFRSAIAEGAARQEKQPFFVPYHFENAPLANGNMLRKPPCHFGWDWNIALAPFGAYGSFALKKLKDARIEHIQTAQTHRDDGSVALKVDVTLYADEPGVARMRLELDGDEEVLDCAVVAGETRVSHVFEVDEPELWWPAGHGEQALSLLEVTVGGETVSRQIGFRTIELLSDPDEAGSRFAVRVNGREIFCRGANWIPADALFSRTSPEKTVDLLNSAVAANMNMIRVWGGGFYEADWFYDVCDLLGLMVWQDFMFACNLYPCTEDFLGNVAAEVDYQVKRLSSHASIAIWCGDNELVGALTWFKESRENRDRYLVAYDRLNRTIETGLKAAFPEAIWWPSSPASGYLDYGDAWHSDGSGDMHYWSVWHENKPFANYREIRPRFCSEFGFQSYTSMPVIRSFAAEADFNIAAPVMEKHQKNVGGNERIAATMFRYFRFPKDFESFVYLSQIQQGLAIKTAVEFWRSLKPHCMGTIYWQLNDTWPVASWASLDYGGGWKAMHYMVRRFFSPVSVAAIPSDDGETISLVAVNDTDEAVDLLLDLFTVGADGAREFAGQHRVAVPTDRSVEVASLPLAALANGDMLFWLFSASDMSQGEGHYAPKPYKEYALAPSGLVSEVTPLDDGSFEVRVEAKRLSLFIMVEADQPGRYTDNAFDLCAGETRTIQFVPDEESEGEPAFKVTDLYLSQADE